MKSVSPADYPEQSLHGLQAFLEDVRKQAQADAHWKLASISLPAGHFDPLAVLESIHEPEPPHFYLEKPAADFAVAGAEEAVAAQYAGANRFAQVAAFSEDVFAHTWAYGAAELAFGGPHVFCAFGFTGQGGGRFPAAMAFVPIWQVGRREGRSVAVANARIDPTSDTAAIARRIWGAHEKFRQFHAATPTASAQATPTERAPLALTEVGGQGWFCEAVRSALGDIGSGQYKKLVLARAVEATHPGGWQPLRALNQLREAYPQCYAFSASPLGEATFVGATPERLVSLAGGQLQVDAIAGSAPRGESATEDAAHGAALLGSDKDMREHRLVVQSIYKRLGQTRPTELPHPRLLRLKNVQHLWTPLRFPADSLGLLAAAERLHPTPAVGGSPRENVLGRIGELEPYDREWFAGTLGWVDWRGEGEMVVGIRSAAIEGQCARFYAGAGIVAGSDPKKEQAETDLKLRALLEVFCP